MALTAETRDAITRAAKEAGLDPAMALATAERESDFDPNARSKGSSAYGTFQMLKAERDKFGGNSQDPYEQAQAWGRYIQGTKSEMARVLGREPTNAELYAGHYWGGPRAARIVGGHIDPETPVQEVFTPRELAANPDLAKAGTIGALKTSVLSDMDRRLSKYGSGEEVPDFAQYGTPVNAGDDENRPRSNRHFPERPLEYSDRWSQVPPSENVQDRRENDPYSSYGIPTVENHPEPQAALSGAASDAGADDIGSQPLVPQIKPVQWDKSIAPMPPPIPTSPPPWDASKPPLPPWATPQQ